METLRLADLHAYVDDCLEPDERLMFENRMAQDPALARRAAAWRAQNNAICAALDGEGARAFSISIVRQQNEVPSKGRRAATVGARPSGEQPARPSLTAVVDAARPSLTVGASSALRRSLLRRLALAILPVGLACVWAPAATVVPVKGLGEADVAAFRAFARPGVAPVELATGDKTEFGSMVDDAAYAPRLPSGNSFRRQAGRSADRSLSWRAGGLSGLQVPRRTSRVVGPVS